MKQNNCKVQSFTSPTMESNIVHVQLNITCAYVIIIVSIQFQKKVRNILIYIRFPQHFHP